MDGSSLSLSGVRNGVDGALLLEMVLGVNKCLCERRDELEAGLLEGDEDGEEVGESSLYLWKGKNDAGLSVTQSDDPLSGGHFVLGVSKAPPRPSRHRRVVVHVIHALEVGYGKHVRFVVESESPTPNGLTTVGGAKTRNDIG